MALVPAISKLRSALALGLTLWCAGTGCLAHGMAMAGSGPVPAKTKISRSDIAMNGHACCKARHRSLRSELAKSNSSDDSGTFARPEDSSSDGANSCCPLTSGTFVTASRSQTSPDNGSASTGTGLTDQSFALQFSPIQTTPLRLPNYEQTYLTCCALLI